MTAYNIARQLDDSFAPGTVIRETPLEVPSSISPLPSKVAGYDRTMSSIPMRCPVPL